MNRLGSIVITALWFLAVVIGVVGVVLDVNVGWAACLMAVMAVYVELYSHRG